MFFSIGAASHRLADIQYQNARITSVLSEDPQPVIVEGVIDGASVLRQNTFVDRGGMPRWQTIVEVKLLRIQQNQRFRSCDGRLLMVVGERAEALHPGDQFQAAGTLSGIRSVTNPGAVDLRSIYRRRGIHGRIEVASMKHIRWTRLRRLSIDRFVASIAHYGRDQLLHWLGPDTGALAVALVVGQRELVSDSTRDQLLVTGTAHFLSVSGLHLAIVVMMARWITILLKLPGSVRLLIALAICLLYTSITGARPPVLRAAILIGSLLMASWLRRPVQPINTLSFAALLLVLFNPELVFSVGVHLSFLAVATLLICGRRHLRAKPVIQAALDREQRLNELVRGAQSRVRRTITFALLKCWQLTWFSGCVAIVSLPLIWHHFHVISLVSVFCNVALAPLLIVALGSGIALILTGWLGPAVAMFFGGICHLSLLTIQKIIETGSAIPMGHFWLPSPPVSLVIVFYIVLLLTFSIERERLSSLVRYGWIVVWHSLALFVATRPTYLEPGTIEATFVDVGHGTSVIIRLSPDDVWLYDCGRLGNDQNSSRRIDSTLWSMGVTKLRGVFLSHADSDHFNALPGLARRFSLEEILTPKGMLREDEPALDAIRQVIAVKGIPVTELWAGSTVRTPSGQSIDVMHPPNRRVEGTDNANSLVIQIGRAGKMMVLPGDLEEPGTSDLINQPRPNAGGLLMAPHHGSLSVDSEAVLRWARPGQVVVSGGRRATRPEVSKMLSLTGSDLHITANAGTIRVRLDEKGEMEVRRWLESPW